VNTAPLEQSTLTNVNNFGNMKNIRHYNIYKDFTDNDITITLINDTLLITEFTYN
jgi:hypothetical protein